MRLNSTRPIGHIAVGVQERMRGGGGVVSGQLPDYVSEFIVGGIWILGRGGHDQKGTMLQHNNDTVYYIGTAPPPSLYIHYE